MARRCLTLAVVVATTLGTTSACGAGSRTPAKTGIRTTCNLGTPSVTGTVNVLAYNSSAIDPFTNSMLASCSHDGITVKHDPIDFAGQVQKTQATLATGNGTYDIVESYGFVIPGYAVEGKLRPLDDLWATHAAEYGLDALDRKMVQGMTYDGHVYGIPVQAQALTFVYRKDVFDKLGLRPPQTFDDVVAAGTKIQESGGMPHPLALPWLSTSDLGTSYVAMLGSLGKQYVDPKTKRPNFDTPESKEALGIMRRLAPLMDPQVTTFDQPKVQQQLYNGRAAMAIMFSGRMNDVTKPENSPYADRFAFATPPSARKGSPPYVQVSIDGWSIPANTPMDPDTLFRIAAASTNADVSKAAVPAAYPARTSVIDEAKVPYGRAVREAIAKAPPAQLFPWVPRLSTDTLPDLAQIVTGRTDVDSGAARMQAIAERTMRAF